MKIRHLILSSVLAVSSNGCHLFKSDSEKSADGNTVTNSVNEPNTLMSDFGLNESDATISIELGGTVPLPGELFLNSFQVLNPPEIFYQINSISEAQSIWIEGKQLTVGDKIAQSSAVAGKIEIRHSGSPIWEGLIELQVQALNENVTIHTPTITIISKIRSLNLGLGEFHTCGLNMSEEPVCFGANTSSQLGTGSKSFNQTLPSGIEMSQLGESKGFTISGGGRHSCLIDGQKRAWCYGNNTFGQLGVGSSGTSVAVTTLVDTSATQDEEVFTKINAGKFHSCGLTNLGQIMCWGLNKNGQLGDGTTTDRNIPTKINLTNLAGNSTSFIDINLGAYHSCALADDGKIWCWGLNDVGQLGDNSTTGRTIPVKVESGPLSDNTSFSSVSAGAWHTCAVSTDGKVWCWGWSGKYQLDGNSSVDKLIITEVNTSSVTTSKIFRSVAAGEWHTCAVAVDNHAYCFGNDTFGQLGNGSLAGTGLNEIDATAFVAGEGIAEIHTGSFHTCALSTRNRIFCWGANGSGQLGNGSTLDQEKPVLVSLSSPTAASSLPASGIETFGVTGPALLYNILNITEVGLRITDITIESSQVVYTFDGTNTLLSKSNTGSFQVGQIDTYGLTGKTGIILSSGNVKEYGSGLNTAPDTTTDFGSGAATSEENTLLTSISGSYTFHDIAHIKIKFDQLPEYSRLESGYVFGGESFAAYVSTQFLDGAGIFLNGVNFAFPEGQPLTIDHPNMAFLSGTEVNGVIVVASNPYIISSTNVAAGSRDNTLQVLCADTADGADDSVLYITHFSAEIGSIE